MDGSSDIPFSSNSIMFKTCVLQFSFSLLVVWNSSGALAGDQVDFNRDVRPILNEHCVACHGGVKQAAELSFVYGEQTLEIIESGSAADSYLMERIVTEEEEERMPPADHGRRLNENEVDVLTRWIDQGAHWGEHWSFVAPQNYAAPNVKNESWGRGQIDPFVLAQLEQAGLQPAEEASPERWLRRVTLDLIGLPPTLSQQTEFLNAVANRPDQAYSDAVDRLLESESFGERWASVWLDVVRYADSRGLGLDARRTIWKYRDWVIKAFNADMPYDQFTIRQLAGDQLDNPTMDDLVATACNRLTQTNEEGGTDDEQFRVEAVIDRVNTTWQAWQGLSFGCVQCHSHPYDPIRHEEYYRFLAYFNNTQDCDLGSDEPSVSVPIDDSQSEAALELDTKIDSVWQREWSLANDIVQDDAVWKLPSSLSASTNNSTQVVVAEVDNVLEYQTKGTVAKSTTVVLEVPLSEDQKQLTAIRFIGLPRNEAGALADSEWGFVLSHVKAELVLGDADELQQLDIAYVIADEPDPLLDPQLSLNSKRSQGAGAYSRIHYPRMVAFLMREPARIESGARLRLSLSQNVFELGAFPLVAQRGRIATTGDHRFSDWLDDKERVSARKLLADLRAERRAIKSVRIPVLLDRPKEFRRPTYVFDRGNYLTKSTEVEAQTPEFLSGDSVAAASSSKGRLALASWIASTQNPLTARVAVNRFWGQLFGTGIVETQEDFGSSGSAPTHPRLLDDLASRFQDEMSWSVKELLRELVLSSTYRQAAIATEKKLAMDPQNRLLSRGPRNRLPAETVRDQALAIAGLLNDTQFGAPVHPPIPDGVWKPFSSGDKWATAAIGDPNRYRKTIYTYTKRSIPFPISASFDAPSREACSMRRQPSNTPLQALMTLNDSVFVEASNELASRMLAVDEDLSEQLRYGFVRAACRQPSALELTELKQLYTSCINDNERDGEAEDGVRLEAMAIVANVLLNLDEVLSK